jgi:hypothetical protein
VSDPVRVAVLIDCDNISHTLASKIVAEAASYGTLGVKRAYGDWSTEGLKGWSSVLAELAIQPVQQMAWVKGKNATDAALIIDAMDLLYGGNVDLFYLVSSDSDFTRLAIRLRESARRVHGIGGRKTPSSLVNACDRFTFTEVLLGEQLKGLGQSTDHHDQKIGILAEGAAKELAQSPTVVPDVSDVLVPAIRARAQDDGWALLSSVGHYVVANNPSFDSRNYGYAKLGSLVRELPFVEVKEVQGVNNSRQIWVRALD